MFVYILRHAIAIPSGTVRLKNDDRPLTKEGKKKMTKAAKGIASLIGNVDLILTSPLIRARDTAKITADVLGVENKIETCEYLAPGSPTKNLLLSLGKYKNFKSILLVGHEPELGFIASALLGSDESQLGLVPDKQDAFEIFVFAQRKQKVFRRTAGSKILARFYLVLHAKNVRGDLCRIARANERAGENKINVADKRCDPFRRFGHFLFSLFGQGSVVVF